MSLDSVSFRGLASLILGRPSKEMQMLRRAAEKRAVRDAKQHPELSKALAATSGRSQEQDEKVFSATASELRAMMQRKEITCEQVMLAFCQRAHDLGGWRSGGDQALNCVTEENYDAALRLARRVDEQCTAADWSNTARFPLLGVPISVKDQVIQKGFDATMGAAARCFQWGENGSPEDGLLLKLLIEAGAIPFVRSNTQQSLMLPESANNIWGTSRNPYDTKRTPGGSSGGEAGLIAARCSPLGIGTDIGGSVRIPCHFCGLYGLKPTADRITKRGVATSRKNDRNGQTTIRGVAGPMAHCVDDLAAVMRAWLQPMMWQADPALPNCPFDEDLFRGCSSAQGRQLADGRRRLRVGVMRSDAWFDPCPTGARAVNEAADALRSLGHEVTDIELPETIDGWTASRIYCGIVGADGNFKSFVDGLEGEPLHPMYRSLKLLSDVPNFVRPLLGAILGFIGEHRKKHLLSMLRSGGLDVRQYWELLADVEEFRTRWLDFLTAGSYDVVLLPGPALPALLHGQSNQLNQCCSYTFLMNLLSWPAGICPVTQVRPDEQDYPFDRLPPTQRDSYARLCGVALQGSVGLPVGVQLAAPPFKDEVVLFAMKELERALPFTGVPPVAGLRSKI